MKRSKALGVALAAALSGGLLVGCTSDSADTTTAATTSASAPAASTPAFDGRLVGRYWLKQGPKTAWVGLEMIDPGKWSARGELEGQGTYEVNGDTITWLGGTGCAPGEKGTYTYTIGDRRLTQTAKDDPCSLRKEAFDGATFTWELRKESMILGELAAAGIETESISITAEEGASRFYCGNPAGASTTDSAGVVVVDSLAVLFDDPDLDLEKVSEVLGGTVTPLKEFCDAGK